jgi:hypothetical protein
LGEIGMTKFPIARSGRVAAAILSALLFACQPADAQVANWIGSWTASPQAPRGVIPISFSDRTIRQIVHLSVGGQKVRLRLSNEFGQRPLLIGAASSRSRATELE